MTAICTATKKDSTPCTLPATGPHGLCWAHDPANADARRRGQSRGGKGKASRELSAIKRRVSELAEGVIGGDVDRADAAVAGQLYNVVLRAVATEIKVKEVEEIEARLAALDEIDAQQSKVGTYGRA